METPAPHPFLSPRKKQTNKKKYKTHTKKQNQIKYNGDCIPSVLVMLPSCKMTGKIILVLAFASTYVALKRVLIPVTAHVNSVKDIVCEVHVTVLAVVEQLRVLQGQRGRGGARLAVSEARRACVGTGLAAGTCHRAVVPLTVRRPRVGARGRGALRDAGGHGRDHGLGGRLLHQERLLIRAWDHTRGRGVGVLRRQAGQLPC